MKRYFISKWVLMGAVMLSACQTKQETSSHEAEPVSGKSEIVLSETQPDEQFWLALESYAKGDNKESAGFIEDGIAAMEKIADSHEADRTAIDHSINELKTLSGKVANNQVGSITELNKAFANAAQSLAHLRLKVTEIEFFKKSEEVAGAHLQSAVDHANRYIRFHKYTPSEEEHALLADTQDLSKRLERGDNVSEEELKVNIKNIDSLLVNWETRFNPGQPHR
jgi:hypothetical protein